jgi:hypothetical protein
MEIINMKFLKSLALLIPFLVLTAGLSEAQQNTYVQSYGPVTSTVACTAATGVNTSAAIAPCGGQGGMFQNSLVTSMTLSWTSVATVSTCTVQLEQSSTGTGSWTLLGTAQTCTSSGTYTATLSAAYVRVNITALTTTTGTFQFNYFGAVPNPAIVNLVTSVENCGTAAACSPVFTTTARFVYGSCTAAAATTCTVTGIAPAFTSGTSYYCQASDATTIATTFKITYASSSSFVITTTGSTSDVFNWVCEGT